MERRFCLCYASSTHFTLSTCFTLTMHSVSSMRSAAPRSILPFLLMRTFELYDTRTQADGVLYMCRDLCRMYACWPFLYSGEVRVDKESNFVESYIIFLSFMVNPAACGSHTQTVQRTYKAHRKVAHVWGPVLPPPVRM